MRNNITLAFLLLQSLPQEFHYHVNGTLFFVRVEEWKCNGYKLVISKYLRFFLILINTLFCKFTILL